MPIYEYRCDQGHTFEVRQRMADDPLETCQTCEAPVQRVFHPVAVHFKGSGFYNTDYGKQRRGKASDGDGESGGGSDSSTESKSGSDSGSSDSKSPSGDGKSSGDGAKSSGGSSESKSASSTASSSS